MIGGSDKKVDIIYDNKGNKVTGTVFKVDGEERYCINAQISDSSGSIVDCYIHDILIVGDKVYYHDTTPGKTDIDITKYVTTSTAKKAPVTPGTNIDITKLKYIDFSSVNKFDYKIFPSTLPSGYNLITVAAQIHIKYGNDKKDKFTVNEKQIYNDNKKPEYFCFNVNVKKTDYFITVKITDKITVKIGSNVEEVTKFNPKP